MLILNRLMIPSSRSNKLSSIAKLTHATASGVTLSAPATIQAGDYLLWGDSGDTDPLPTAVVPSGFTTIDNFTTSIGRVIVAHKIADGSEASSTLTGMTASFGSKKVLIVYRGDAPIKAASVSDLAHQAKKTLTSEIVTASNGAPPLIVIGVINSDDQMTMNPTKDGQVTSANFHNELSIGWKIFNDSPVNVTVSGTAPKIMNFLVTFYVELS